MRKFLVLSLLGLLAFNACDTGVQPTGKDENVSAGRFPAITDTRITLYTDSGKTFSSSGSDFENHERWVIGKEHTNTVVLMYKWDWFGGEGTIRKWEKELKEAGVTDVKFIRQTERFIDDLYVSFTMKSINKVEVTK